MLPQRLWNFWVHPVLDEPFQKLDAGGAGPLPRGPRPQAICHGTRVSWLGHEATWQHMDYPSGLEISKPTNPDWDLIWRGARHLASSAGRDVLCVRGGA